MFFEPEFNWFKDHSGCDNKKSGAEIDKPSKYIHQGQNQIKPKGIKESTDKLDNV